MSIPPNPDQQHVLDNLPNTMVVLDLEVHQQRIRAGALLTQGKVIEFNQANAASILSLLQGAEIILGHNIRAFDLPMLDQIMGWSISEQYRSKVVDTLELSSIVHPGEPTHRLEKIYRENTGISDPVEDCLETFQLYEKLISDLPSLPSVVHWAALRLLPPRIAHGLFQDVQPQWQDLERLPLQGDWQGLRNHVEGCGWYQPENLGTVVFLSWVFKCHLPTCRRPTWIEHGYPSFKEAEEETLPDSWSPQQLTSELQTIYGAGYGFREGQLEIVSALLSGYVVPLGLLPTGGGKSLTFQFPALLLSKYHRALTVVVSPLQALMEDQVINLQVQLPDWGSRVAFLSGTQGPEEQRRVLDGVWEGHIDLLYVSPERLRNPAVLKLLKHRQPHLWVLDEAHTLSQWGMDFRPDFLRIPRAIREVHQGKNPRLPRVGFVTATATKRVIEDLQNRFVQELQPLLQRQMKLVPELVDFKWRSEIQTDIQIVPRNDRQDAILERLQQVRGEGVSIVYVQSRRLAEQYASALEDQGFRAAAFHARITPIQKKQVLSRFKEGELEVVVATSAFGMGIDRAGIHTVIHAGPPSTPEAYLQEIGRVARKTGETGRALLLWDDRDFQFAFEHEKRNRIGGEKSLKDCWHVVRRRLEEPTINRWVSSFEFSQALPQEDPEELFTQSRVALFALESYDLIREGEHQPGRIKLRLLNGEQNVGAEGRKLLEHLRRLNIPAGSDITLEVREVALLCALRPNKVVLAARQLVKTGWASWSYEVTLRPRKGNRTRLEAIHATARTFLTHLTDHPEADLSRILCEPVQYDLIRRNKQARLQLLFRLIPALGLGQVRRNALTASIEFSDGSWTLQAWMKELEHRLKVWKKAADDTLDQLARNTRNSTHTLNAADLDQSFPADAPFTAMEALSAMQMLGLLDLTRGDHELGGVFFLEAGKRNRYNNVAYRPLEQHYHDRTRRLHAMREILKRTDEETRIGLIRDYFTLTLDQFCQQHMEDPESATILQIPEHQKRILGTLSPTQKQVVTDDTSRALLVLAGPGSGKTRTIVHRVANLVALRGVPSDRVLVLAYNRTAVAEVRERLAHLIGPLGLMVDVYTFHGLARKLTGSTEQDAPRDLPEQERYDWVLQQAVDFLEENPSPYQYVLVDEYQDIKGLEYELVTRLASLDTQGKHTGEDREQPGYLVAVGDDDQNLYAFQGADVQFIHRFQQDYDIPAEKTITLTENYRSAPRIVKVANTFIEHALPARSRLKNHQTRVTSVRQDTVGQVRLGRFQHRYSAAWAIAREIRKLTESTPLENIAVLARTWDALKEVQHALRTLKIRKQMLNVQDQLRPANCYVAEKVIARLLETPEALAENATLTLEQIRKSLSLNSNDMGWQAILEQSRGLENILYQDLALSVENTKPVVAGGVVLSTFHSAKGSEFDHVFVISDQVRTPTTEDDARTLYVALTRAKDTLTVLFHAQTGHPALRHPEVQQDFVGHGVTRLDVPDVPLPASITYDLMPDLSDFYVSAPSVISQAGRSNIQQYASQWGNLLLSGRQILIRQTGQVVSQLTQAGMFKKLQNLQDRNATITPVGYSLIRCTRDDTWYARGGYMGLEDHHHMVWCLFRITEHTT